MSRVSLRGLVARGEEPAAPANFRPAKVLVVDVEDMPAVERTRTPVGRLYGEAWLLARAGGRPLGMLKLDFADADLTAGQLDGAVRQAFGSPPNRPPLVCGSASVTVVIPTCRRPDDVERCVNSVLTTDYPRLQVLVVDNAPDDRRTAAMVRAVYGSDPRVEYLSEPVPGASRARNRGVRAATGVVIAFVDDDIVVDRHWIAALTAAFEAHPDVSCVTGLVLPRAVDTAVHWWFELYGGFDRGYVPRRFDLAAFRGDTLLYPYTAGSLGGLGNAAFRRDVLSGDDPFDVTLGPGTPAFGAEDQDALLRVLRAGGTILYEPSAIVQHRHRDTYAELRWQVFTYGAGFVAALTHWSTHDRAVAMDLLKRVPPLLPAAFGLRAMHHPAAHVASAEELPKELRRLGQLGYLYGPVAYARALLARRRADVAHRGRAT